MANATKIYSIQANYDSYKSFVLSNPDVTLRCKGKPLNWPSPQPIEIDEEDAGVPEADIALLNIGSFIVSENVKNEHFDRYKTQCEFIPLDRDGQRYFAVNVINVIECLDNDKSTFNEYGGVVNPAFDLGKIPEVAFFKIKEDNFTNIFCTESVLRSIEEANLTGALFEEYAGNS